MLVNPFSGEDLLSTCSIESELEMANGRTGENIDLGTNEEYDEEVTLCELVRASSCVFENLGGNRVCWYERICDSFERVKEFDDASAAEKSSTRFCVPIRA